MSVEGGDWWWAKKEADGIPFLRMLNCRHCVSSRDDCSRRGLTTVHTTSTAFVIRAHTNPHMCVVTKCGTK